MNTLKKVLPIALISGVLVILIFLLLKSCSPNYEQQISRKIKSLVREDGVISESDFNEIKETVKRLSKDSEELETYLLSDSSLLSRIKEDLSASTQVFQLVKKPEIELEGINFYIETSASMGGYMNGGTEFQDVGNYFIGLLRDPISDNSINYINFRPNTISANLQTYNSIDQYASDLTNSKFHIIGSSPLHEIFKIIIDSSSFNDLNFFITDGIMSGTNDEIISDEKFNIKQRVFLSNQIKSIFSKKNKDNWGLLLYSFYSNFNPHYNNNWAYFCYNNKKVYQNFNKRPFYVFVFGNKYLLENIIDDIETHKHLDIKEKSYFGLDFKSNEDFVLFKSCFRETNHNSMIKKNKDIICNIKPSNNNPIEFAIALNMSNLPEYLKNIDYLDNNITIVNSQEIEGNIKAYKYTPEIKTQLNHKELEDVQSMNATHYLVVRLTEIYNNETTLHLTLNREYNHWYEDWSCDDDLDIASKPELQNKTFNLKYLVQGIEEAFTSDKDVITDIKIKIINK